MEEKQKVKSGKWKADLIVIAYDLMLLLPIVALNNKFDAICEILKITLYIGETNKGLR